MLRQSSNDGGLFKPPFVDFTLSTKGGYKFVMETTQKIADAVGRSKMSEALNVGATAVSKAVVAGRFPPSWFLVMQSLCCTADIDCPPSLFGMKSANGGSIAENKNKLQYAVSEKVNGGPA